MKIAVPEELPSGLPSNVLTHTWLPQVKVLSNKKFLNFLFLIYDGKYKNQLHFIRPQKLKSFYHPWWLDGHARICLPRCTHDWISSVR